jgi:pimeloyl-ACP methyl ester carboxylesterase
MPIINISSLDLFYEIYGDGPPLIMIIGLGANSTWWGNYFLKGLAKYFKVIVFDNRGTGRSGDPKLDYSINTLADDTLALMDALNIQEFHIFGHSMGGYIAQELTLNYNRVNKLILCSTSCGGPTSVSAKPEVLKIVYKPRTGRSQEEIAVETLEILYSTEFIMANPNLIDIAIQIMSKTPLDEESYFRQTTAIQSFNTCNRLKNLDIPTLILHGMKDVLVPPQNADILGDVISNSQKKIFSHSAHAPFVEEPDLVRRAIIKFLL